MKNFTFTNKTRFDSCGYDVYEYDHISGAKLIYIDSGTEEKSFCAAFKTIPEDSTGVFHILEHSVLDGSKNYPMNSPFLFMLKNSMNTFLNAMTFQGKTMYPCASCNPDDFENLMKVYLDALFNPILAEGTFLREGWHIEKAESGYDIKGVVYNEMQGAGASTQRQLYAAMKADLYPDTYQRFNSGGEPSVIPSLTYENYLAAYRKYYSTANCVLFLRGNMDIDRYTDIIDEWLAGASQERSEIKHTVQGKNHRVCEHEYPISPSDDTKGKTNIIYSYSVGKYDDAERQMAASLLALYLMDNSSSPLKKALTTSGLMQDADIYEATDDIQTSWGFAAYNTEKEHCDEIKKIIDDTIQSIIDNGIDKEIMLSQISATSFRMKEQRNAVKGLCINDFINIVNNVFYGLPINAYFEIDEVFAKFERELDNGYFENLLRQIFFENDITATSVLVPVKRESSASHLATVEQYTAHLSDEVKDAAHKRFIKESKLAMDRDTPETIAKMPTLSLDKLTTELPKKEFYVEENVLYTPAETNGIAYYRFYFSLAGLSADEIITLELISRSLGDFATTDHTAAELLTMLNRYAGKWNFSITTISPEMKKADPYLVASVACLEKNAQKALEVVSEIVSKTVYDLDTAKTVLARELNNAKMQFMGNGVGLALNTSESLISASGYYATLSSGYPLFAELQKYVAAPETFCENAKHLLVKVFNSGNLSYTGLTGNKDLLENKLDLTDGEKLAGETLVNPTDKKVAYAIPAGISFNVRSLDVTEILPYSGKHIALSNLLSLGYLWHNIREVGGAYGTGLRFARRGSMNVYSYRDPKVKETYALYDGIADYLANNEFTDGEILGCIISTLADFVNPKSVEQEGIENEIGYLANYTYEEKSKHMAEVLSFTKEDIKKFIPVFEKFKSTCAECSVGNGANQTAYGKFDEIVNI
ncbi:MAG: insulinase family protein [Clostridia bacterium]|nr:insulinase family protein [Clostridia bacterium]